VGTAKVDNVIIHPGNNTLPLSATTDQSAITKWVLANPGKYLPMQASINGTSFDGQELPYFVESLQGHDLILNLNLTSEGGWNNAP
jgi:hypothetical protein